LYGILAYCDCIADADVLADDATAAAGVGRLAAGEEEMLRSEYSSMAGGGVGTYLFTGVCTVDPR